MNRTRFFQRAKFAFKSEQIKNYKTMLTIFIVKRKIHLKSRSLIRSSKLRIFNFSRIVSPKPFLNQYRYSHIFHPFLFSSVKVLNAGILWNHTKRVSNRIQPYICACETRYERKGDPNEMASGTILKGKKRGRRYILAEYFHLTVGKRWTFGCSFECHFTGDI